MHRFSRPRAGDAPAIYELTAACDTEVLGRPDLTLDDITGELAEPGFDLDRDAWLAHTPDGRLDGWAWARRQGDSEIVDVDVIVRPTPEMTSVRDTAASSEMTSGRDAAARPEMTSGQDVAAAPEMNPGRDATVRPGAGLAGRLWPLVLERAGALARERGHAAATADVGVYRADRAKQSLVQEYGFATATSFHRMRIDFEGPVEPPQPPPGVTLHSGQNEQVRREAHRVHQDGFADHFGHAYEDYDRWYARRQALPTTDWSLLTLARLDGRPAAMVLGNDQFAADEGCGYVATLAVLPEFRGRGLGRLLLRHAFAADAARGRKGTILHVDGNNTTPALGLYESAGMRPILVIDIWRRTA